jgi:hypothetical protein
MPLQDSLPGGEKRDCAKERSRPPSDPGLRQVLAGEELLEEARSVGQRIWTKVWKLLRTNTPRTADKPAPWPDEGSGESKSN